MTVCERRASAGRAAGPTRAGVRRTSGTLREACAAPRCAGSTNSRAATGTGRIDLRTARYEQEPNQGHARTRRSSDSLTLIHV
jgi:hypothetical protein